MVLVGHSRGAMLAVRLAERIKAEATIAGLILLDPVDAEKPQDSCLPSLSRLKGIPVAVLALPFSGYNRYYKTPNTNLCAPVGRNARAFFDALGDQGEGLLMTLPGAGHLQLLDDRPSLAIANVCGVGTLPDDDVRDLASNLVVGCCQLWFSPDPPPSSIGWSSLVLATISGQDSSSAKTTNPLPAGFRPLKPQIVSSVTWEVKNRR